MSSEQKPISSPRLLRNLEEAIGKELPSGRWKHGKLTKRGCELFDMNYVYREGEFVQEDRDVLILNRETGMVTTYRVTSPNKIPL